MFKEALQGEYRDKVKWFAGVADNVVHVTLHDMQGENIFYDHMIHIRGREQFEIELSRMCEHYISRFVDGQE
tara:strand:- start:517 stop:732 length:216 start_codon:yes stop_codon:yes gene_type:complete